MKPQLSQVLRSKFYLTMPLDVLGGYENLIYVLHLHVTAMSQNITR